MQRLDPAVVGRLAEWVPRRDLEAMRILHGGLAGWVPRIVGMSAVTFAPFVLFRAGAYRPGSAAGLALVAHEAAHITQVRQLGRPRFYARYLLGQLRQGFRHDRHPLEVPCIELQRTVRAALRSRGYPP
ncbi:eCIS core domain-containing protein [Tepidiforma sp.]|uniref:eCIS core domain-containing protein n=1 Tax=Tepidiforma sp. TaxID=2682230 RepID=UPI002ADE7BBA|nr:DUF4157 domain-containing protein [Tepidiforma sp.]